MPTTLTVCKGCLRNLKQGVEEEVLRTRVDELRERIELQLGPVDLRLEDCLHHCLAHEVCLRLEQPGARRPGWAHLRTEPGLVDPVEALLTH